MRLRRSTKRNRAQRPGRSYRPHPEGCVKASKGGYGLHQLSVTAAYHLSNMAPGTASRQTACLPCEVGMTGLMPCLSSLPGTGLRDQQVAQHLQLLRRPQLLGIDEDDGRRRKLHTAQTRHEVGVIIRQVVRDEADT